MNLEAMNSSVDESVLFLLENEELHEGNHDDEQQSPTVISVVIGFALIGTGLMTLCAQIYYHFKRKRQKVHLIAEQNQRLPHMSATEAYLQPSASHQSLSAVSKQPSQTSAAPKVFPLGRLRHAESNVSDESSLLQDVQASTQKKTRGRHWNMSELSGAAHEDVYAFQGSNDETDEESQKVFRLLSPVDGATSGKYHVVLSTEGSHSHDGEDKVILETTAFGSDDTSTAMSRMSNSYNMSDRQNLARKTSWEIDRPSASPTNISQGPPQSQHSHSAHVGTGNSHGLQRDSGNKMSKQGPLATKLSKSRRDSHTMNRKHPNMHSKNTSNSHGWNIDMQGMPRNSVRQNAGGAKENSKFHSDGNSTVITRSTASRSDGSYTVVTRSTASSRGLDPMNAQTRLPADAHISNLHPHDQPTARNNTTVVAQMERPFNHGMQFVRDFNPYDPEEPSCPIQEHFDGDQIFLNKPRMSHSPTTTEDWPPNVNNSARISRRSETQKTDPTRRTTRSESPHGTTRNEANTTTESSGQTTAWTLDPTPTDSGDTESSNLQGLHLEGVYYFQPEKKIRSFGTDKTSQCSNPSSDSDEASFEEPTNAEPTTDEIKADLEALELLRMHRSRQGGKVATKTPKPDSDDSVRGGRSVPEVASELLGPQSMQTQVSQNSSVSRSSLKSSDDDEDKYSCIDSISPNEKNIDLSLLTDEEAALSFTESCEDSQAKNESVLSDVTADIQLQVKMLSSFVKSYKKKKQQYLDGSAEEKSRNAMHEDDDLESGMKEYQSQNDPLEEMTSTSELMSDKELGGEHLDQPQSPPSPTNNIETNEALQDTCETSRDEKKRDEILVQEQYGSLDCSLLDGSQASKPSLRPIQTQLFDEESSIDHSQDIVRKRSKSLGDKLDDELGRMSQGDVLSPTSYQSSVITDYSSVEEPIKPRLGISPRNTAGEQSEISPHMSSMMMASSTTPLSSQNNTPASFVRPAASGGQMSSSGVLFTSISPRSRPRPERQETDTQATVSVAARKAWVHNVLLAPKGVPFSNKNSTTPSKEKSPLSEPAPVETPAEEFKYEEADTNNDSCEDSPEKLEIQIEATANSEVKRRITPGTPTTHIKDLGRWIDVVQSKNRKRSQSEDLSVLHAGVQKAAEGEDLADNYENCQVQTSGDAHLDCIDVNKKVHPLRNANSGMYVNTSNSETVEDDCVTGKIRRNSFPSRLRESSPDNSEKGKWKYQLKGESSTLTPSNSGMKDRESTVTVNENLNVAARAALLEKGKTTPVVPMVNPSPTSKLSPFEAHKLKFQKMDEQVQNMEQDEKVTPKQPSYDKPVTAPESSVHPAKLAAWRQKLTDRFSPPQHNEEGPTLYQ